MNENKYSLLKNYIKSNIAPILIDDIDYLELPNCVILSSKCSREELNGHYENVNFVPPKWYQDLLSFDRCSILIIDRIDLISKDEQTKFIEILKYRKVSTFELPKNTIIIVTAKESIINEEVYSFVVDIRGRI